MAPITAAGICSLPPAPEAEKLHVHAARCLRSRLCDGRLIVAVALRVCRYRSRRDRYHRNSRGREPAELLKIVRIKAVAPGLREASRGDAGFGFEKTSRHSGRLSLLTFVWRPVTFHPYACTRTETSCAPYRAGLSRWLDQSRLWTPPVFRQTSLGR
jgi:hypothetical protein